MFRWLRIWWGTRQLLRASDYERRCDAARALGAPGDLHAVDPLIHALGDEHGLARRVVADTLPTSDAQPSSFQRRGSWAIRSPLRLPRISCRLQRHDDLLRQHPKA